MIFGGLELGLRFFGYGYPTSFFLQTKIDGSDYYVPNVKFGDRFFPPTLARTPTVQRMAIKKSAKTYRIFVFGESAAMGDPDPSFGAWRYLQVLLRERFPGTDFEVICTAMTAIDSYTILPIARECARRNGDLWIIYMGNNEMVGPFGAGTVFGSQAPGVDFVRADLALKTTRLGQLLDGLIQQWIIHSPAPKSWSGLSMFKDHQLRYDDPNRLRAYENFKRNLADILCAGRNAGVPIILSTVGSNLKDCAPFGSLHSTTLNEAQLSKWKGLYREGIALESANDFQGALKKYEQASAIDPQYAVLHFRMGQCQLALTNSNEALHEFELARDYDTLAFRADTRINNIIGNSANACHNQGVYALDAAKILAQDSPSHIPGNGLFYEHVHFNFHGNYVLGRMYAEETAKLLPKYVKARDRGKWASEEFCDQRLAVSPWDRYRVWQEILSRIDGPPYTEQLTHAASIKQCQDKFAEWKSRMDSEKPEQTRQMYEDALALAPNDSFLHFNFAQYLGAQGDLARATRQAQKVCELLPEDPAQYYDIGNLLILQGKIDEAQSYYSRALAIDRNFVNALNGRGLILANRQKSEEAMACFKHALRENPNSVETYINLGVLEQTRGNLKQARVYYQQAARLQPQGLADYLNEAVAAATLGQHSRAVEYFEMVNQLKPEFWQAHYLLGVELADQGKIHEARLQFSQAIRYRPDFAEAHLELGLMLVKQQEFDEALTQFQIVLQLDPANQAARQQIQTVVASKDHGLKSDLK